MLRWIRKLIGHWLGLDYVDGYWEAVAENCPEFWDDVYI